MAKKLNICHSDTNFSTGMVEKSETLQLKTSRISKTRKDSYARETLKYVKPSSPNLVWKRTFRHGLSSTEKEKRQLHSSETYLWKVTAKTKGKVDFTTLPLVFIV